MNRPQQPCPRICDRRSAYCRKTCEAWMTYEKEYIAYMDKAHKDQEILQAIGSMYIDSIYAWKTGKKRRKKKR